MPTYENHLQKQNQLIAYDSRYSEGHPKSTQRASGTEIEMVPLKTWLQGPGSRVEGAWVYTPLCSPFSSWTVALTCLSRLDWSLCRGVYTHLFRSPPKVDHLF